jgi:hypothetical protein
MLRGLAILALAVFAVEPSVAADTRIGLTKPFHTASQWSLSVSQDPPGEDSVPGLIHVCFIHKEKPTCPELGEYNVFENALPVYPTKASKAPLLVLRTSASWGSGRTLGTKIWAYRRSADTFELVFANETGGNNNQETRLVTSGKLAGDIIVVTPPQRAPFAYGITVYRPSLQQRYVKILEYRGRTRENDGNPLAVIDSEMPEILRRLHLAKPGDPLPSPLRRPPGCDALILRNGIEDCRR